MQNSGKFLIVGEKRKKEGASEEKVT